MPVTASDPTPAELLALQALLDRSTRTATPALADSVAYPARQMSAAEFVEFWPSVRLVAMATVGPAGQPHIAPVHAELAGTMLRLRIYEDTVRRQDLATNPRVAFTTWRADGAVAIFYGRAREPAPCAAGTERPAAPRPHDRGSAHAHLRDARAAPLAVEPASERRSTEPCVSTLIVCRPFGTG